MLPFNLGTPATSSNTSFGFGQKPATGFNLTSTPFGTTTSAPSLTFGSSSTPSTTTSLNFGFSSTPVVSTQTQSSSLALGANTSTTTTSNSLFPTTTTSAPLFSGLNFGTPVTSNNLSFGVTSNIPSTGNTTFSAPSTSLFGGSVIGDGLLGSKTVTSTTTATNKGLGGLDVSASNKGLSQGNSNSTTYKENVWPPELIQTIEKFKEFVKEQKVLSSDIARGSVRPLHRCAEDTALLMEILTTLAGSVQRDRSAADKLKQDTAKSLQNAEIAQRTHDTPPGLQYENNAPLLFFMELADNFEHDLMLFRSQIESTEKHIQTMMTPKTLTPQELTMAMSKLHESLVAVAGKLQGVHSKVQQHKEQYLNFRKYVLKDNTNVFEDIKVDGKASRSNIGKITSGPTPFGPGNKSFLSSTALSSNRSGSYETRNLLVWRNTIPSSSATNINLGPSLKPPTASLTFNTPTNLTAPLSASESSSSFQLQKPPIGNKRGKH
ncbi:nuclear pore complex protein Nup58 isoform X3 [Megalopta genalis]|uniref:nuclear pore complex protein Nup58 isoform X3 n=1 Tax=Megalopta genalis TaxID=115081 RepID=UPI0014435642|nr:nucleoporin p58/p45 isoform X3 [Megalopta genalis]